MYEPHPERFPEPSAPPLGQDGERGREGIPGAPWGWVPVLLNLQNISCASNLAASPLFPNSVYLVSQPPIIVAGIFSSKPTSTICPSCRQHITTQVTYRLGKLSYLLCTSLCMVGCCFGCCFVPLFIKLFKDADHYCPYCQFHIYRYKRL
uniref:LITAF domain-containing protein n=1 Tax=Junco hyemalis TaxID=40217 RepID=A0A8C5JSL5_JUNHY